MTLGLSIPSSTSSPSTSANQTPALSTPADRSLDSTAPTTPAISSPAEPNTDYAAAETVKGFGTRAIHVGSEPDKTTGAVIPPISLSTTFAQSAPGVHSGFEYSRSDNPNRRALEHALASIEEGVEALAFSSGSAALATVVQSLQFLKKDGPHQPIHILSINDVYGGTYRYLKRVGNEVQGLEVTFVDMETADEETIVKGIRDDTKLVLVETPTNPTLKVVSIPLLSRIAHTHPAAPLLMVDNTFASPFYQNPLKLGADLVLHSLTKYVNGHSDVVMGAVILPPTTGEHLDGELEEGRGTERPVKHPNPEHLEHYYKTLRFMQNALGAVPSAYDSWLAQRGLKTLHLRMKAHGSNALAVALGVREWVKEQRRAGRADVKVGIGYAGLPAEKEDDPEFEEDRVEVKEARKREIAVQTRRHNLAWEMLSTPARKWVEKEVRPIQTLHLIRTAPSLYSITSLSSKTTPPPLGFPYTGMLTVTLPTYEHALRFLQSLELFTLAESLGGVESLAEHPASMTHAGIPVEERRRSGVEDGLVRLSVGVEEGEDLVGDVRRALGKAFEV
ncbi:cystathionine gamma-lyase [Coprinopsis cinerea okayama7|uniref:cystathionine gamma-lyase n=1 Tax=Coprinopsis cinerea (strain Okayama-7 / 130 / ATCC MYA-4618 / FGSC 9003) TaxID=240176 RepID=A8PB67_COPC7|nr:cystathionine gamma-lyase [Coprinopsis cinerea okayama7\|eukprot:XP_001840109.1 cystathionine gamma-lyase [Coprinopsis cinerea okayama7\